MATALICDDDKDFQLALKYALRDRWDCVAVSHSDEALKWLATRSFDLVLLDVQMRSSEEGLEAIPRIKELDPELPIIMVSGTTDFKVVREAMRLGAHDYVPKDFDPDELALVIDRALERRALVRRQGQRDFEVQAESRKHPLVGKSPAIQTLRKTIEKMRSSPANVLITGETGSGKEIVARQLRAKKSDGAWLPFVAVDSATIQSSMAESLLFGHEKGAFTGALQTTKGVFEEADGGIVYFDEIGNMGLEIQAKLLRVLQEKEVLRLGSLKPMRLDFRVISATNLDLEKMCRDGRFKADLLQRLNVLPLEVPALRERSQDIPQLVAHFLAMQGRSSLRFSEEALALMGRYPWPGNVRELGNVVAYVAAMAENDEIEISDLPPKFRDVAGKGSGFGVSEPGLNSDREFYRQVSNFEKELLSREYASADGNVSRLAVQLGMDRSHLHSKLKEYGIHRPLRRNVE